MIPTYNCAGFLAETLRAVLAQDPGPEAMQIEVVDDASNKDDPASVVAEVGRGRVAFHRQAKNVGHIANFDTCLRHSRGEIVHLLHGDDLVLPGFYASLQRGFDAVPGLGAAFCRPTYIDSASRVLSAAPSEAKASGLLADAIPRLAEEQRIMTPSIVVRRAVYEALGGFDRRLVCSEDWEMWVRIAARYPIWYEPQSLALYRMHDDSNTGRHVRSAADMAFTRVAIDIFQDYLPVDVARKTVAKARATYARTAIGNAAQLLKRRDWIGAFNQYREAFRLAPKVVISRLLGAQ
jgi:glycosyltransferase involved in cell wall biosynthesis